MKSERSDTASFSVLTFPSMTHGNQHSRTDTIIIRPKSSDSAGNFILAPSTRTGCGEKGQGGAGIPYPQPFPKAELRATPSSVLLGDSSLSLPP